MFVVMQAEWFEAPRCHVRQSALPRTAAELRLSRGPYEPGRRHGQQLRAGNHRENEDAVRNE